MSVYMVVAKIYSMAHINVLAARARCILSPPELERATLGIPHCDVLPLDMPSSFYLGPMTCRHGS